MIRCLRNCSVITVKMFSDFSVSTIRSGLGSESTAEHGRKSEMREIYAPNYSGDKEEKLIVIMAGDELPSFIAMPTSVFAK